MDEDAPHEQPLYGGVGPRPRAARVGGTVRRPVGRWTEAVHAVLAHLADVGFDGAPRLLGFDEEGREVLTFIEGRPGVIPLPEELLTDAGLASVAELLSRYHDAVSSFRAPDDAVWASGRRKMREGEIVLHRDPGPWNTIWRGGRAVAFVDWDLAEPGTPIVDVAYGCWLNVPLRDDAGCRAWGFDTPPDRRHRLRVFCRAYGTDDVPAVLRALEREQVVRARRVEQLAAEGLEPWREFALLGLPDRDRRETAWLRENWSSLV